MVFLPIVDRELRVASRRARSYWLRIPTAGLAIIFFGFTVWTANYGWHWNSTDIFQLISWAGFVYCLFGGVLSTADCLSVEKRQNTLGLLFLTDLRGYDIALGKLCATSISSFFGLLAIMPVLAIPVLMGGVQYAEFWRVALSLGMTLLFSLAVGLYVSTRGDNAFGNTAAAMLLIALIGFGVPALVEVMESYRLRPRLTGLIMFVSPFHMHVNAFSGAGWAQIGKFWISVGTMSVMAGTVIAVSCWRLLRIWQDVSDTPARWSFRNVRERWRRWNFGVSRGSRKLRGRLLEQNPFAWLAGRGRVSSMGLMILFMAIVGAAFWLASVLWSAVRMSQMEEQFLLWLATSAVLHVILLAKISSMASERFGTDRQSGALELLLCTPIQVRTIVAGQWRALRRQLLGPASIALLVHGLVLYIASTTILVDARAPTGPSSLFSLAWQNLLAHSPNERWPETLMLLCILGAAVVLVAHWIALGWVGMWLALRLRLPRFAPWGALGLVVIPPWAFFALTLIGLIEHESAWSESRWIFTAFKLAMFYQLSWDVGLSVWAAYKVRTSFRHAAGNRFDVPEPSVPWPILFRRTLRWAAVPAAIAALIGLFHFSENRRGERAWAALQRELNARGERLDVKSHLPPPVARRNNFAEAPIVAEALAAPWQPVPFGRRGRFPVEVQSLRAVSMQLNGQPRGYSEQTANWTSQKHTDLERWQKDYRARGLVPTNTAPRSASSDVLLALSCFSSVLDEIREASQRPECRYPVAEGQRWESYPAHLTMLADVSEVLRCRASAELSEGRASEAFADLQLCLYLANSLAGEPFPGSHSQRNELLMGVLQIVWEGFANGCWSEPHSMWLQGRLSKIDRLADFPQAARAHALTQMDFWSRKRMERSHRGGLWKLTRMFSPVGWTYLNEVRIYRSLQTGFGSLVDPPPNSRVHFERARTLQETLSNSGYRTAFAYPYALAESFGRVQTGLNLAVIACALERFRLAHGTYPGKLEALVPEYIDCLPHDVANGEPLRYQLLSGGQFVLYSVGPDGQDDGGVKGPSVDWVWKYSDPGVRRR